MKSNRKNASKKQLIKLYNNSYLAFEVVNNIKYSYELLRFCSWFPHWFQRRVVEVKFVYNIGPVGFMKLKKEIEAGIYVTAVLDDKHLISVCVHKVSSCFKEANESIRGFKALQKIVKELDVPLCMSIINSGDFCADLPDEFYDKCPKVTDTFRDGVVSDLKMQTGLEDYSVSEWRDKVLLACSRKYCTGGRDVVFYWDKDYPKQYFDKIVSVKERINNLVELLSRDNRWSCDYSLGIIPFETNVYKYLLSYV